jgi:hypothetical protein
LDRVDLVAWMLDNSLVEIKRGDPEAETGEQNSA